MSRQTSPSRSGTSRRSEKPAALRPLAAAAARLFFARLMESLPDHVYFKDREGRFLCINRAHATYLGLSSPDEAIGRSDFDFFEESLARQKDADEREIVRSGVGFVGKEEKASGKDGRPRWVLTSKLPLFGDRGEIIGTFGISRNITEIRQARDELQEHHRLLETLIEILPCRIFVKDRAGRLRLTNQAYRHAIGLSAGGDIEGRLLSELVADDRTLAYAADDRDVLEGRSILNREDYDASPLGDKRWMLISKVPLRDPSGNIEGLVGMAADITAQKEAEARAVAAQKELAQQHRQIESELALARQLLTELMSSSLRHVQEALAPDAPFVPRLAFHYEACAHLAGDFFQLVPLSPRSFGVLFCDVMGHGVKAALVTTLIRGLLAELRADGSRPAQVLDRLNQRLCPLLDRPPLPRFVTALYAVVDAGAGRLTLASAGHPWPLVAPPRGSAVSLTRSEPGPALGLISSATYQVVEHSLGRGERLLFFTDGWFEQASPTTEQFGLDRLRAAFAAGPADPAAALQHMAAAVRRHAGQEAFDDDLCAILAAF